jgi:hypothetical protein
VTAFLWEYVFPVTFWAAILRPGNISKEKE